MDTTDNLEEAVEALQEFGLKEYEARCFVGLSRVEVGTAKRLSEVTEVPRTRVYDAIRVLEAKGLVEIQHSSPKRFRAVSLDEATETLRNKYEARVQRLRDALDSVSVIDSDDDSSTQQVWAMTGQTAIENRSNQFISDAADEVVLVIGDEALLTAESVDVLNEVGDGVDLVIGVLTKSLEERVQASLPGATTFISGLEWLQGETTSEDEAAIGRLLLIDRSTILVSSIIPETREEHAIFSEGFGNGVVVVMRRLMVQELAPTCELP